MTGLRYEPVSSGFSSRVRARIEVRAASNDTVLWEHELGIARDECPRVRRDYYVSYLLTLPPSLPPGPHCLRLIQADLAADQSAFAEIDLTIAP
jgi:hypothetical protein